MGKEDNERRERVLTVFISQKNVAIFQKSQLAIFQKSQYAIFQKSQISLIH